MRITIIALAMLLSASVTNAQKPDTQSANYLMPGCRNFIRAGATDNPVLQGLCAGSVNGIAWGVSLASLLCTPDEVTLSQEVRVVVAFIDARPARMHEDFRELAFEALLNAWPCRK